MAERNSWPSIQKHGLLSTTALLDLYKVTGPERVAIEARRRAGSVALESEGLGQAVVRDQFPMDDKGLSRCLGDDLSPEDWYRILNAKVFFWLTKSRLFRLLGAGTYRDQEHDVLEVDAATLIGDYREKIWLCPMNSGCTKPMPHPRGNDTFKRIPNYPYSAWKDKRPRGERVVELCVDYGVPDISRFVKRVVRMKGDVELEQLYTSGS